MAKVTTKAETKAETPQGVTADEKLIEELKAKIVILEQEIEDNKSAYDLLSNECGGLNELLEERNAEIAELNEIIKQQAAGEAVGIPQVSAETEEDKKAFEQAIKDGLAWFVSSVGERFFRCNMMFTQAGDVLVLTQEQLDELKKEPNLKLKQVLEVGEAE